MASSNIKLFDENKGNMLTDTEFNISAQRLNGLQTGVASSQLQNKAMYQVSLVAYAIAQVMMQNGLNANDTDAVSTFVANLSNTMLQKVYDIATTAEAQAGVATGKWMSPALVKAAIDALAAKAQNVLSDTTKTLYGLDSSAVPNDVFVKIKQKFSECVNPNLLDNPYFANPVDQRGGLVVRPGANCYDTWGGPTTGTTDTYYTAIHTPGGYDDQYQTTVNGAVKYVNEMDCVRGYTGAWYGIDRWYGSSLASITLESDGVLFVKRGNGTPVINTYLEKERFVNGYYTISVCYYADNKLELSKDTFYLTVGDTIDTNSINVGGSWYMDFYANSQEISNGIYELRFYNSSGAIGDSCKIIAVKLELGSQQTLAHQDANGNWVLNEIPNYWEELLKCIQSTADPSDTFANKTVLHTGNAQHLGFPKIAIGSYVGTGTYGSANPNSLTFDFEPKIVFLSVDSNASAFSQTGFMFFIRNQSGSPSWYYYNSAYVGRTITWSGNTLSWYTLAGNPNDAPDRQQFNVSGQRYCYVALG